jgi:hypothetical protein
MLIAVETVSDTLYEYELPDCPSDDVPVIASVDCETSVQTPLCCPGRLLVRMKLSLLDSALLKPKGVPRVPGREAQQGLWTSRAATDRRVQFAGGGQTDTPSEFRVMSRRERARIAPQSGVTPQDPKGGTPGGAVPIHPILIGPHHLLRLNPFILAGQMLLHYGTRQNKDLVARQKERGSHEEPPTHHAHRAPRQRHG